MEKDATKKEIDSLISKRSNHFAFLVVLGGGSIGLLFNLDSILKIIFFIIGLVLITIFLRGLLNIEDKINDLIKELRELK
ncbi:MAG: hypothetical protein PHC34_02315 [Candidatus Gastranaerophilales bacterium]|nr:hypothetical protein [Candidatus Gastranaerophilales bacterium]